MDWSLVAENLLNPPILFFVLGLAAVAVRSDLEIPQPIPRLLALYLLFAIGFYGGVELRASGLGARVLLTLLAAAAMAVAVPLYSFFLLRLRLDVHNAAAIAATYGSISAVTFITAASFAERVGLGFGGHMVAAMALMESPAVVIGILLTRWFARDPRAHGVRWSEIGRDAFLNGAVFLLVGSLVVGLASGEPGWTAVRPFAHDIFKGVLTFFLLDMGLVAARRFRDIRRTGGFLVTFAVVVPLINAALALALARAIGLGPGDAFLFVVLCASASYIAVPAAMRLAVPEASPSLYVPMALAVTFPFNIVLGLPLYLWAVQHLGR